ncbi:sulfite oxidase [Tundrisphaera sp. TA3]|uniref:sulfite oxidase n=1 Tax=Tundrisphaera sp. TA3 TaxID=3435775 RepID=UPI003EBA5D40
MGESSRREFLQRAAAGAAIPWIAGHAGAAEDESPKFIVRSTRPLDAETPVEVFDRFLTPNRLFFVRSHFGPPVVGLTPWSLAVDGMVDRPLTLGLDDLKPAAPAAIPAVLQCSGNGRALFRPQPPGVAWERGAVGNAEWGGVPLADLLRRAGVQAGAGHVILHAADGPPNPKTPAYLRSIPLDRAMDPSTLVATTMNGEPLPWLHGGPIRLVVPGWSGNHWIKWLRKITVSRDEAPSFYQQTGYKVPKVPTPPGVDVKPADQVPVTTLNVKSLIARTHDGTSLGTGRHQARGVAWTGGDATITRVEFAAGPEGGPDAPWVEATLQGEPRPYAWRLWTATWEAPAAGRYLLRSRATDSRGDSQPETPAWNKSGYLWNGIDRVTREVR